MIFFFRLSSRKQRKKTAWSLYEQLIMTGSPVQQNISQKFSQRKIAFQFVDASWPMELFLTHYLIVEKNKTDVRSVKKGYLEIFQPVVYVQGVNSLDGLSILFHIFTCECFHNLYCFWDESIGNVTYLGAYVKFFESSMLEWAHIRQIWMSSNIVVHTTCDSHIKHDLLTNCPKSIWLNKMSGSAT